ncbi:ATP-binding protein [Sorangium sp. So ce145]|uniref:ATP-binding protein n=1 Tax=Sorangium sp. So ce145 TaxID=3133285 RepID=UPI003F5D688D
MPANGRATHSPHRGLWGKTTNTRLLGELTSLHFLDEHRHAIVLGSVSVEKTSFASALGHLACKYGYEVRFRRADAGLPQSRLDNSRNADMAARTTADGWSCAPRPIASGCARAASPQP